MSLMYKSLLFTVLLSSAVTASEAMRPANSVDIVISGDDIQALTDTHYRVKVEYSEAVKVRCVGFYQQQPVAIDSIAVIPPYEVSNMFLREDDGGIDEVKCWVTSTRAEDLNKDYIKHH